MVLTDQALEVVAHFTRHIPSGVREVYEAKVREMLKHRHEGHRSYIITPNEHEDDDVAQATCACVNVMWMLWSQARSEFQIAPVGLEVPPGGRSSTNLAGAQ
jgi:hypothetical protein